MCRNPATVSYRVQKLTDKLARLLVTKRYLLLFFSLLIAIILAAGIARAGFDTSLAGLMTRSDPYLQERDRMQAEFPSQREISFAFAPHNENVFSMPTLLAMADLSFEFRQIPLAESMASILAWQSPFGNTTLFERPLRQLNTYSEEELITRRERALADSFITGSLLSPRADLALVSVRIGTAEIDNTQRRAIAETSIALRDSLQARHPEVDIFLSGEALFEYSTRQAMISDLTRLLPLVLFLCIAAICFSFRSVFLGICILGVALLTVIMTVGSLGWLLITFSTISVMAPIVVVTIAVADSVHIISIYLQNIRDGMASNEAMQKSLRFNFRPITLATLTTAIGFASLNLASSPAISDFGSVVATGVVFAYFLTLSVLPALVLLVPTDRIKLILQKESTSISSHALHACQRLVRNHSAFLLWGTIAIGLLALALSFLNKTDFDRLSFINEDSVVHDYFSAVSERMERGPQLVYGVDTGTEYGVINSAFLKNLDSFSDWLRQQEEVISVASLVEVVKTINQVFYDNQESAYLIPESNDEIEEHLFNYQQVQARDFTLENFVTQEFSLLRLFITTNPMRNQQIIDLNSRINTKFAEQMPEATLLHGSSVLLFARMDEAVTIELMQGYGFSLLLITITLIIGMKSIRYGLLSVLPNLLPATLVFGVWGLFVGQIDPFIMMLFSISIGLVVDDSVHVLSTYQSSRASGCNPEEAVNRALTKAGPALIITTAVMSLGTCVLIVASTLFFQQAATLLVPIVVLALVLDLTFFPALLLRFDKAVAGGPAVA